MLLQLSQLFHLCTTPPQPPPLLQAIPTLSSVPMGHVHVVWLLPLPSPSPPTSCLPVAVSLSHLSMPLFLSCLLVYIVHQILHISEIIRYLSFSDWLISLRIIVSRSIHAVAEGKISFFYFCIVVHCVNVPQLFYPLIY